ncbi:MAG: efflux RND transporter periplasmic adaptor subunit [Beijerinckiaceae bacterium]|nr:efflux RND transporter periplasmic adaptor subunit [Beijerinckiaceae bacterium]
MKRILTIAAVLALAAALAGALLQRSRTAPSMSGPGKGGAPRAEQAVAKDEAVSSPAGGEEEAGHAHEDTIEMAPERVEAAGIAVAPAGKGVIAQTITVPGTITLDPGRVARVPGRVVGTVTQMRKRLGDMVSQGEVVAVLDSREVADTKSEYLTASVAFDLQKTLLERVQTLWAKRFAPEQRYLQARETFQQAELRLDLARQKLTALNLDPAEVAKAAKRESAAPSGGSTLREYQIRSMIAGRVIERKVDVGSLVGSQGDPADLYTIADLSEVWLELAVPVTDLDMIAEGQAVTIASLKDSGKRGEGRIIFISPLVDPNTRSARVTAAIGNQSLIWRPGTVVSADVAVKEEPVELSVPRTAIQTMGGESVVFVRTQGGFERRDVTLGKSDEQTVEITSGLSAGEEVAVSRTFLLKAELGKGEAGHEHEH